MERWSVSPLMVSSTTSTWARFDRGPCSEAAYSGASGKKKDGTQEMCYDDLVQDRIPFTLRRQLCTLLFPSLNVFLTAHSNRLSCATTCPELSPSAFTVPGRKKRCLAPHRPWLRSNS